MPAAAAAAKARPGVAMVQSAHSMVFRISEANSPEKVDALLEQMDTADERIAAILKEPAKTGFFSDFDEGTEALQRELFGLMASNYLIFRALQGRSIAQPPPKDQEKKTLADTLSTWITAGPLADILAAKDQRTEVSTQANSETEGV